MSESSPDRTSGSAGAVTVPVALADVSETLLWTLRDRADEAKHPGSSFSDPWSVLVYGAIEYDYARFGRHSQAHALRAATLDRELRTYLDDHPKATVVALGEGLQTTYWRMGSPAVPWLSVDLEPVQRLRERLLPHEPWIRPVPVSALDRTWLDLVTDPSDGVFVSAEGLFMYFERDDVLSLIAECAARFPGGRLLFDSIPAWFSARTKSGLRRSDRYTAPRMPFSLSVSQARRLPRQIPGVATATDLRPPAGRGPWASRTLAALADRPPARDLRPNVTLLTFADRTDS